MRKLGYAVAAVAVLLGTTATSVLAQSTYPGVVPEINPGSVASGIALLMSGALIVRARLQK